MHAGVRAQEKGVASTCVTVKQQVASRMWCLWGHFIDGSEHKGQSYWLRLQPHVVPAG
jgi:hypothetical protein